MRKRTEFDRAFRSGRSRHSAHFRAVVARGAAPPSRLGLVVSRRVGRAHERNLVKRRIREFFRTHQARLIEDVDVVVIAKPGAALLDHRATQEELNEILETWLRLL